MWYWIGYLVGIFVWYLLVGVFWYKIKTEDETVFQGGGVLWPLAIVGCLVALLFYGIFKIGKWIGGKL